MRADRLIAALLVLQARGRVTAAELADELEVSVRTARRDLEALAVSGVPVYSQPGRGGGWQLLGGARTDLTGLSSGESRALFLALSESGARDPLITSALRKLLVALPERFRDEAQVVAGAIRVDASGWGQVGQANRPRYVDELSQLLIEGRRARIDYQGRAEQAPSEREVHPLGLVTKRGVWYLVANTDRGLRTFRLDRISRLVKLDAPIERPEDFDLDAQWQRIVSHVESQRLDVEVRIRATRDAAEHLRWMFGTRFVEDTVGADGWITATLCDGSAEAMAAQLSGFGAQVRVLEGPDEVIAHARRIAEELAAIWLQS